MAIFIGSTEVLYIDTNLLYHIPGVLAAIKFGEMARNRLEKVNLKFGNSHEQIESYDVIMRATYAYSHFSGTKTTT